MHQDNRLPIEPFVEGKSVSNPQISPDGNHLTYLRSGDNGKDLVVYSFENQTHRELLSEKKISTGTAYGGETYCWNQDSDMIIYSIEGQLYRIDIKGGMPEEIVSIDKSFHPQVDDKGLYFIIEHDDHMSLATSDYHEEGLGWPKREPIRKHFIYDPVRHSKGYTIAHIWNYPNMSWDGSSIVKIEDGTITTIAGDEETYVAQPRLSPDQTKLSFISEESGWMNLWIADADGSNPNQLVNEEAIHCYSTWVSGARNQVWLDNSRIAFTRIQNGTFSLVVVNTDGDLTELDLPNGEYSNLSTDHNGGLTFEFSDYQNKKQIRYIHVDQNNRITENREIAFSGIILDAFNKRMIEPYHQVFPTRDGKETHGWIYEPESMSNGKAPLLIQVHGGPTGMSRNNFNFNAQYFANQGWIVVDMNYRGSIGYGREYRQILHKSWGDYDVDDCVDAIQFLTEQGKIDENKVAIMGGSAGGFTTLMALVRYPGTFAAGVNLYGVADMFLLAEETHYLEAHYLDTLIGELPQEARNYYNRSPINFAEEIVDPLLILQGEDDPVVPKNQSQLIYDSVQGIKQMKIYEGEGHGFKKTQTLKDMYPRIDSFLRKYVLYNIR